MRKNIKIKFSFFIILFTLSLLNSFNVKSQENDFQKSKELVQLSESALNDLLKNKDLPNIPKYLKKSKAILIFPEVYEGGFLFGAKGGNGLLFIRHSFGWSGPFFYSIGGLSIGLQFGIKSGKVLMTVMSNRGVKSILNERVKIGVDIDAAVAGEGVGYSAESTLRLADIFSFSDNSGLFLGGSLEGSYLQPRNDLNLSFYNKELTVNDILKSKKLHRSSNKISLLLHSVK